MGEIVDAASLSYWTCFYSSFLSFYFLFCFFSLFQVFGFQGFQPLPKKFYSIFLFFFRSRSLTGNVFFFFFCNGIFFLIFHLILALPFFVFYISFHCLPFLFIFGRTLTPFLVILHLCSTRRLEISLKRVFCALARVTRILFANVGIFIILKGFSLDRISHTYASSISLFFLPNVDNEIHGLSTN